MVKPNQVYELTSSSCIGFFDSGIGGLTILKEFLPFNVAHYVYVADTAHMPYGNKSPQDIQQYSQTIIQFLLDNGCDHIVIACHTATALALDHVTRVFKNVRITGVIEGVVREALAITKTKKIGIIATSATIASGYHEQLLKKYDPTVQVYAVPCPQLASAIEFGTHRNEALDDLIKSYIEGFSTTEIDTLILGSTHYDIIQEKIRHLVMPSITVIGASQTLNKSFQKVDDQKEQEPTISFFITGSKDSFAYHAQNMRILPYPSINAIRF